MCQLIARDVVGPGAGTTDGFELAELDFELRGQAGETYRISRRQNKPGFAIYKGPLKIASGEFEYG